MCKHYTQDEMNKFLDFYNSDVGKKIKTLMKSRLVYEYEWTYKDIARNIKKEFKLKTSDCLKGTEYYIESEDMAFDVYLELQDAVKELFGVTANTYK